MMSRSIAYKEAKKILEDKHELAVAYLRARVEARTENKHSCNNNNDIKRLEKVALLLNRASALFNEAMNSNNGKRRELLEEAFKAYVDIVPYLGKTPYLTYTVLKQIKSIEQMIELEIENSVKNNNTNTIDIDNMMKKAREAL
jgi:hypothetical protein